jgi:NhaA family Na+:H+ antiporter
MPPPPEAPPGSWEPARRLARKAKGPVERFLSIEASSGILLMIMAVVALAWANSPFAVLYQDLWHTPFGLRLGPWSFTRDLHFWINDGLMTVFFFVVGLEIRREIHQGELSELRRAALPLVAALGGMVVPALIYISLNVGRPSAAGWGVPMATDIAFAVGVLVLLGKRVAPAVRVLLLALAVIDDVGAILVIAFFYSGQLVPLGFLLVVAGAGGIVALQAIGVRSTGAYVVPATLMWAGAYAAGIHPTLAGVAVGLMTPARRWAGGDEAQSPVERLQHALHGWVAYGIMPLFALANAGVRLGGATFDGDGIRVFLGVFLGLLLGKPIGVLLFSWLSSRIGLARAPAGVGARQLLVVGLSAGIGFTMALFIAGLAFPPGPTLATAKLGILAGSAVAGTASYVVGRAFLGRPPDEAARSEAEAEASTRA